MNGEPLTEGVRNLAHDMSDLVRAELALFKSEALREGRKLAMASVWIAAAAVMGLAALGAFTALCIIVLTLVFPTWLAALIITIAWGAAAISLLAAAKIKLDQALPIEFTETTRSVKEDIEWIKSGMKSAK